MNVLGAGQRIADRYQLDRRIAVGGMGEVWEASDTRLGRSVAVKVLRPELSDDPEFLHRFRIEARTVASLDHNGIAAVHDYGEDDPTEEGRRTAYLVMELVRGEPLSALIARGPIAPDETLRILEEAARALEAAHARGFVHRDVKPGNILVRNDGLVKITDFGIAKAADAVPVTRSGMVMGTAHYIAPEQASGAEAGPAGDVYSLGVVGYECLAGHRPFRAESAVAVAMMQVRDAPPPLPAGIPFPARELIESALVKDPKQRYASGGEFADAVAAIRRGESLPSPSGRHGASSASRQQVSPRDPSPVAVTEIAPAHRDDVHRPADSYEDYPPEYDDEYRIVAYEDYRDGFDGFDDTVTGSRRSRRRGSGRANPSAPPTEALRLQPSQRGRGLLLVLFVLLTVAAVVLGIVFLRGAGGGEGGGAQPGSTGSGAVPASDGGVPSTLVLVIHPGGSR